MQTVFQNNLVREIRRIAAFSMGEVGVVARHMTSGEEVLVGDESLYPLASSVKMALALAVLDKVEQGELALNQMIETLPFEMNPHGPGGLGEQFFYPGISLSLRNHLEGMVVRSCNTSTDVLFRVVGGTGVVAEYLQRLGIADFACSRTMREALCVLHELPLPPDDVSVVEMLKDQPFEVLDARNRINADFHHDQRDHARPSAMLLLLEKLWKRDGVSDASAALLIEIMGRTVTATDRVLARLPEGIPFASKGGSGAGAAVDVGFITLPEGRGTLALAIFIKSSPRDMDSRNRVIADIARLVVDAFILIS